jgi:hypothetical protein
MWYWIPILLLLYLLFFLPQKQRRTAAAAAHHIKRKGKKEREAMEELAKQFIGKECIIYTITQTEGSVQGTIREVGAGGMMIEDAQGQLQAVNLEYVTRIREFPRDKKGKKKSVILD